MDKFQIRGLDEILKNEYRIKNIEYFTEILQSFITLTDWNEFTSETYVHQLRSHTYNIIKGLEDKCGYREPSLLISVEGNMGIGKSTWIKEFTRSETSINIMCLNEPVSIWQHIYSRVNNKNLFQLYYESIFVKTKYAELSNIPFLFHSTVSFTKWLLFIFTKYEQAAKFILSERSIFSDRLVDFFAFILS